MAGSKNFLLLVVIAAVAYFLIVGNPFTPAPATPANPEPSEGSVGGCSVEDVTFVPKMTRLGKSGTSLSTAAYNYFILTDKIGSKSGATSTTVPTNWQFQVMYGENSTSYYTVVRTESSACADPFYTSVQLPIADQTNGLASFYITNPDGSINSANNNISLGADDEFDVTITIKAGADEYFGNPTSDCQNVGVVDFDKTYIKSVTGDNPTAKPSMHVAYNTTYDGQGAFIIPKSADGQEAKFSIKVESASSDPSGTGGSFPILTIYDCDIDKNEDTLALIQGVEDEDNNMLSLANNTKNIWIS